MQPCNTPLKPFCDHEKFTRQKGFTSKKALLLGAAVSAAFIVSFASLNHYKQKQHFTKAKAAIEKVLSEQRLLYVQTKAFTTDFTELGYADDTTFSKDKVFELTLLPCSDRKPVAKCIKVVATPIQGAPFNTIISADTAGVKLPEEIWQ